MSENNNNSKKNNNKKTKPSAYYMSITCPKCGGLAVTDFPMMDTVHQTQHGLPVVFLDHFWGQSYYCKKCDLINFLDGGLEEMGTIDFDQAEQFGDNALVLKPKDGAELIDMLAKLSKMVENGEISEEEIDNLSKNSVLDEPEKNKKIEDIGEEK